MVVPLTSVAVASTGFPDSSVVRHDPMASKFSSANPGGSMAEWHVEHTALVRCFASRSRMVGGNAPPVGSSGGGLTPGGGGGGGGANMLWSGHLPRSTGDVRFGYEVVASIAPCASSPPRRS